MNNKLEMCIYDLNHCKKKKDNNISPINKKNIKL